MAYRIGSFNCLNFGLGESKDVQKIVDIINEENFDIVALQELKGKKALDRLLKYMSSSKWDGIADDTVNDYAFIWNKNRIKLAETNYKERIKKYEPRIYKQYKIDRKLGQTDLKREPYYARFYPIGGGSPFIEIRIINCHIRFSKNANEEFDFGAIALRRNEFDVLTKAIYSKEADKRYGDNRPAYTIMLGDYNLNSPSSQAVGAYLIESFEMQDNGIVKRIVTKQNELTTLKKQIEESGNNYANNYDHFTFDENRFADVAMEFSKVDAVNKYSDGDFEAYSKTVSDHVPILMELKIKKG